MTTIIRVRSSERSVSRSHPTTIIERSKLNGLTASCAQSNTIPLSRLLGGENHKRNSSSFQLRIGHPEKTRHSLVRGRFFHANSCCLLRVVSVVFGTGLTLLTDKAYYTKLFYGLTFSIGTFSFGLN